MFGQINGVMFALFLEKEIRENGGNRESVEEDFKQGEEIMAIKKDCGSCFKIPSTV